MLRPKKNSYKEFDNEKKFLRLKNSPPITFLMVRPLRPAGILCFCDVTKIQTLKSQGLLRFYLQLIKDPLQINFCASFQRESFFRFENIALSNFPIGDREAVRYAKKIILLLDIMPFEWWKY